MRAAEGPGKTTPDDSRIAFVLALGRALHGYGIPAPRLEQLLGEVARHFGLTGQFFSTPTSIFAGFGTPPAQQTFLLRVEPAGNDLDRLADTDGIVRQVIGSELTAAEGLAALERIHARPPAWGRLTSVVAFVLASGAAARFLGGGTREILAAGLLGGVTGILGWLARSQPRLSRVFEPVAATLVAFLAAGLTGTMPGLSEGTAVLAGLIVLIPGLTLTTAVSELATGHLSAGTSRFASAAVSFLGIVLGVAVGTRAGDAVFGAAPIATPVALPGWTNLVALPVAGVAFAALLQAPRRDVVWVILSGAVAFAGARLGGALLGPEIGVFVGSLGVGLWGLLYARLLTRPGEVVEVPGLLILVPGSVGFRSLIALQERDVLSGVQTAYQMMIIAIALVAGLLIPGMLGGKPATTGAPGDQVTG